MSVKPDKSTETTPIPVLHASRKTIPVICPWCNKLFRIARWNIRDGSKISPTHGICPDCLKKIRNNPN